MKTLSTDALLVVSRQELIDTIIAEHHTIEQLQTEIDGLKCQLDWLKRQIFGTKSERFIPSSDLQMALDMGIALGIPGDQPPPKVQTISYDRSTTTTTTENKVGHGRGTMPTHLPFIDVVIEPKEDHSDCIHIGDEVSWEYEFEPGSLKVKRYIRPKFAKPFGDGIVIGELPARPIEKGNAGAGLMTQVTIDKYVYHMPLDRQRKKFKNEYNVDFSESWLCDIVKNTAFWIEPVYKAYVEQIVACDYLQADETPIPVLTTDGKGKTHRGYFWVLRVRCRLTAMRDTIVLLLVKTLFGLAVWIMSDAVLIRLVSMIPCEAIIHWMLCVNGIMLKMKQGH
jgi:transposase